MVGSRYGNLHLVWVDLLQDFLFRAVTLKDRDTVAMRQFLAASLVPVDERDLVLRGAKNHADFVLREQSVGNVDAQIASANDQYVHMRSPIGFDSKIELVQRGRKCVEVGTVLRFDKVEYATHKRESAAKKKALRLKKRYKQPACQYPQYRHGRVEDDLERAAEVQAFSGGAR